MKKVCKTCGSEEVLKDAWASWNIELNQWELEYILDGIDYCQVCDGETTIINMEDE